MRSKKLLSSFTLVLVALIWGVAFVAQSDAMRYISPFTFNAARSLIAGVVLIPISLAMRASRKRRAEQAGAPADRRTLVIGGVLCGVALAVASALQQFGVMHTTVGKAGFITALYIVIVPLFGIFLKKRPPLFVWIAVAIAVAGMYLLCINEGFSIALGDTLVLLCAVGFAVHILVIDSFSPRVDCVMMSMIQFFVCAAISAICMFIFEKPDMGAILDAWVPILYAGALSSGAGYTLQIIAQKNTPPTVASLIMSLESVFAVLAGWLMLNQSLSERELIGCVLVFAAIVLAQLPDIRAKRANPPHSNSKEATSA
ncbi:MAG: DMT family transporter [Clostridia bacterium]|nr:DMT family transporter [Clostridia bacterium]